MSLIITATRKCDGCGASAAVTGLRDLPPGWITYSQRHWSGNVRPPADLCHTCQASTSVADAESMARNIPQPAIPQWAS